MISQRVFYRDFLPRPFVSEGRLVEMESVFGSLMLILSPSSEVYATWPLFLLLPFATVYTPLSIVLALIPQGMYPMG